MAEKLTFQNVLDYLLDSKKAIPQSHLKFYSDLDAKSLQLFLDVWKNVKPERKSALLDALAARYEADTMVSYEELGRALLKDADAEIRARALRLLAEADDPHLVDSFIEILLHDAAIDPRIEAAALLGEFILLAELDKINMEAQDKIENALVSVVRSDADSSLRKHALEALGYSSHHELAGLIESAYERSDPAWVASALRAMGRSQDDEQWREDVISKLLDEDPHIRLAAVEAAGALNLQDAGPIIMQILDDDEEDETIAAAAVWSLSQIGGEDARAYLVNLIDQTEDEDILEYLEAALENLNFNEELGNFDLLELDEDEDEDQ